MPIVKNTLLSQKLRELRGSRTLYSIEKEIQISRGTLLKYETGQLVPEKNRLTLLSKYYKVSYESLFGLLLEDLFPAHSLEREIVVQWAVGLKP
jgi:transcriptional regulator with XRE-family HTH domain